MSELLRGGWATICAYSITPFQIPRNEYLGCMFHGNKYVGSVFTVQIIITGDSFLFAPSSLFNLLTFDWFSVRAAEINVGNYFIKWGE